MYHTRRETEAGAHLTDILPCVCQGKACRLCPGWIPPPSYAGDLGVLPPDPVSPFPMVLLPRVAAQSFGPKSVALIAAVLQLPGAGERGETEPPALAETLLRGSGQGRGHSLPRVAPLFPGARSLSICNCLFPSMGQSRMLEMGCPVSSLVLVMSPLQKEQGHACPFPPTFPR